MRVIRPAELLFALLLSACASGPATSSSLDASDEADEQTGERLTPLAVTSGL